MYKNILNALAPEERMEGVSVVICCFNSKTRIPETLRAIAVQQVGITVCWEVVLVDNGSTDGTAAYAEQIWNILAVPVPFQVVKEPEPGLLHARRKGISTARYDSVLFCDDDTWLCSNYLETIFTTLHGDPSIAACGGKGVPHFESVKPLWFDKFSEVFATGPQPSDPHSGKTISLYGAGLGLRRSALDAIALSGYQSMQIGRKGTTLSSSEDTEITNALVLLGFSLEYLPSLHFTHFLHAARMDWSYLRKMFAVYGDDGPVRNLLYEAITDRPAFRLLRYWSGHLGMALYRMMKYLIMPPKSGSRALYFLWSRAYITRLFEMKKRYQAIRTNIAQLKPAMVPSELKRTEPVCIKTI